MCFRWGDIPGVSWERREFGRPSTRMGSYSTFWDNSPSTLRPVLLLAAVGTYLFSRDNVVWHFIKFSPRVRLLEHVAFGFAAFVLGVALLLKVQASSQRRMSAARNVMGNLLQALGIASLLPFPGFLLLVFGDLGISLLSRERQRGIREEPWVSQTASWTDALVEHIGLCCAFASMIVFSIVLIDRVADALFAMSALISLLTSLGHALKTDQVNP